MKSCFNERLVMCDLTFKTSQETDNRFRFWTNPPGIAGNESADKAFRSEGS